MSHGGRMQEAAEELERVHHPNGRLPEVSPELLEARRVVREAVWAEAKKEKRV